MIISQHAGVKRYNKLTSEKVNGVKETADINNAALKQLFSVYGVN